MSNFGTGEIMNINAGAIYSNGTDIVCVVVNPYNNHFLIAKDTSQIGLIETSLTVFSNLGFAANQMKNYLILKNYELIGYL